MVTVGRWGTAMVPMTTTTTTVMITRMIMAITTITMTDLHAQTADLMRLSQWLSPAFPVGGYAYSHGLEALVHTGRVHDAATAADWLTDTLQFGAGRSDALLLGLTLRGQAMADLARAMAPSAERWSETIAQGTAFARAVSDLGVPVRPAALPVAVGQAAQVLALPHFQVISLYLQSFAANLVQVAVRHVPLGQTAGQAILRDLAPVITGIAEWASTAAFEDLSSSAFSSDIAAMEHENQEVRIYKT